MVQKALGEQWRTRLRRVPIVALLCVLMLGLWGMKVPEPKGVICDRTAPGTVSCQATLAYPWAHPWAWLPQNRQSFELQDIAIDSDLCDNTPRGGVRFCHRLTLVGASRQITLPEVRTPLSAAALSDYLRRFVAGEGSPQLSWSTAALGFPGRTLAITLLLAIATWALWDVR